MGGCTLYIEASKSNFDNDAKKDKLNKGSLIVTGNLQDVMKESCQLAYSYAKYILATLRLRLVKMAHRLVLPSPQLY
jgi:ATP-dependent Lon protease